MDLLTLMCHFLQIFTLIVIIILLDMIMIIYCIPISIE